MKSVTVQSSMSNVDSGALGAVTSQLDAVKLNDAFPGGFVVNRLLGLWFGSRHASSCFLLDGRGAATLIE